MKILDFALEVATKAHAGQKRKDGKDYITHPIEVQRIAKELYRRRIVSDRFLLETLVAAIYHDIGEDCGITEEALVRDLKTKFLDSNFSFQILLDALKVLNKNNHASYFDYIFEIKLNKIAKVVKLADLTHNLSDLKDGSLKDKYMMAKWILEH